jgi:Alpha/beta hydrolase
VVSLVNISVDSLCAHAGGDPWQVNATVQHGRPAQIDSLAQSYKAAGKSTADADSAFAQARQRFEQSWDRDDGEHPINDSQQVQLATTSLGVQADQLPKIAVDLEGIAAALAEAQRSSRAVIAGLDGKLQQIDKELGDYLEMEKHPLTEQEQTIITTEINELEQEAITDTKAALLQVTHIRDGYAGTLRDAEARLRADGYNPALVKAMDDSTMPDQPVPAVPPPGTSPEDAFKWWNSLTPEQKSQLIAQHPPELGNLKGIPVDVTNEVNRAVMNDDISRVQDIANSHELSADQVLGDPNYFGLSPNAVMRYNNAIRSQDGLVQSAKAVDAWGNHPDVFLMRYEPDAFNGDGGAAIAMGNPDKAANTTFVVKGLGSGVKEGTLSNPDGVHLFNEANAADWNKHTAVVMWVGYDAPDSAADPGLYEPNMARTGGQALAADVNSMAVTHQGAPTHMTVVGHSYGSTTVADAAAGFGMHADDIVLVGSPGTDMATSVDSFHLNPGGHLYVGDASGDPVSWLGHGTIQTPVGGVGLGPDPAMDGYGSVRFKAEVPGFHENPFYDHSHYFDPGSESLFSLGDIASGHGDALEHDGMTAGHRGEYGLPPEADPEAVRPATTGHYHRTATG